MDPLDQELDSLFAAYREAVPDPDAGVDFMPKLWERIEAKRSFVFRFRRMSQLALAAALAASLLMGVLIAPLAHHQTQLSGTYVDVLAEAHPDDAAASMGGVRLDLLDNDQR